MGIIEKIKGAVSSAKEIPQRIAEAKDRAEEIDLAAKNRREMEASAQRIEYEKQIREKQMQGKITPEMAEKRRQENARRYESNIKTTGEKAKEVVSAAIKPATDVRKRNIKLMEKQKLIPHQYKRQPAMREGQFHSPSYGAFKGSGNMMNIDPFAGISGVAPGIGKRKKGGKKGRGGFFDPLNF